MTTVTLKQNDTEGLFTDTLKVDDVVVDLTGCAVRFLLRKPGISISQNATIVDALTGSVSYQPTAEDVAIAGKYQQEWEVAFSEFQVLTFPNNGWNTVIIKDDLDP